ncbi:MAG: tRNA pseudouridine(55) synthase TruB [Planctomycetaceae bacterium]|nr:tRNA pseudouridine(55) synthase TruB [Planctomycetaceae bacterium]
MYGIFNLNKPAGVTSRDCVNQIQRMIRPVKCGHAGTLDPTATGVLLVCAGPATRLMDLIHESSKTYVAEFLLGIHSNTDDISGELTAMESSVMLPNVASVQRQLQTLPGAVMQVPPAFSAVHINGQRAYQVARDGGHVELTAREVMIHSVQLQEAEVLTDPTSRDPRISDPVLRLSVEITCGSGTYIRSIARDLGRYFGCGGLMSALIRTRIGRFRIEDAIAPADLQPESLSQLMLPPQQIVAELTHYSCTEREHLDFSCGRRIPVDPDRIRQTESPSATSSLIAVLSDQPEQLIALAELRDGGRFLQPCTVFIRRLPRP